MRVDLKSILLGFVAALVLFIAIGQTNKESNPVGRFQVIVPDNPPDYPSYPFLLDTKTGKCWRYIGGGDTKLYGWIEFPFADSFSQRTWQRVLTEY